MFVPGLLHMICCSPAAQQHWPDAAQIVAVSHVGHADARDLVGSQHRSSATTVQVYFKQPHAAQQNSSTGSAAALATRTLATCPWTPLI